MPYISNKRPKPKPPQNNVMTISKALKAVNDNMDWTVLFIALLLVMVWKGTQFRSYLSLLLTCIQNHIYQLVIGLLELSHNSLIRSE